MNINKTIPMTRLLATLAFLTICHASAKAQIDIGTKLGGVTTDVRNNANFSDKNRLSYQFGLYLNFDALPLIGVQTEVLYNRTRVQSVKAIDGLSDGMKGMGYWSLPVIVQVKPLPFLRLGVGPQWNFHTNRYKYKLNGDREAFSNYMSVALDAQVKVRSSTRLYLRLNKGLQHFENLADGNNGRINRWEFGIQRSFTK